MVPGGNGSGVVQRIGILNWYGCWNPTIYLTKKKDMATKAKKPVKKTAPKKKQVKKAAPRKKGPAKKTAKKAAPKKAAPKKKAVATKKKTAPKKKSIPAKKTPVKRKASPAPVKKTRKPQPVPKITSAEEQNDVAAPVTDTPVVSMNRNVMPASDRKSMQRAAVRNYDNHHLSISSHKKGGPKPSGKKPLW